jgi:hypothetical protein
MDNWKIHQRCQKIKDKRSDIVVETKPKRFGIVPEIVLLNRLFRFGPESALLDQIDMCSFHGADSGTNSDVLEPLWNDCGTFVERLLFYCFDIYYQRQNEVWRRSYLLISCMDKATKFLFLKVIKKVLKGKNILIVRLFLYAVPDRHMGWRIWEKNF